MATGEELIAAQVGYGMFGADVVAGTIWDLQRNGISPYLDRIGLDDLAGEYSGKKVRLVAVGTRSEASALRAAEENERQTGHRPRPYHGERPWEDILDDWPDLDLLVIATPDHLHAAPAIAALERGVHVVVEKPMCMHAAEAAEILRLSRERGLIVGVDMHKRYDPDHKRLFLELLPQMGSPIHVRGVLEEPLEVSTQVFKWAEQSDPFTYVGIHWVDLFCHYLKLQPLSLYAAGVKKRLLEEFGRDTFDATHVVVTHVGGTIVSYENNWITPADFEGPVNQESHVLAALGKVESDSQYRGLRYWIENKGSRTANVHFFRKVRRPDGSEVSIGYGKDSLVDCIEKVYRIKFLGASAAELEGTYPDAASQQTPVAIIEGARACMLRNWRYTARGEPGLCTVSFSDGRVVLSDPTTGERIALYEPSR
ncbi:MAG: Gfo/Idh/MocA family oxidoreductase [Armatimonadetes bacterium]|nr:Gfo/Idh/MocA family oxidoreductase [Armatimonadota bacterium]